VTVAATVLVAVLPVAAVTGDPLATATAWLCVFPFCYLAAKYVGKIGYNYNQKKERK
jgi:hypothetical protein